MKIQEISLTNRGVCFIFTWSQLISTCFHEHWISTRAVQSQQLLLPVFNILNPFNKTEELTGERHWSSFGATCTVLLIQWDCMVPKYTTEWDNAPVRYLISNVLRRHIFVNSHILNIRLGNTTLRSKNKF